MLKQLPSTILASIGFKSVYDFPESIVVVFVIPTINDDTPIIMNNAIVNVTKLANADVRFSTVSIIQ